MGECLLIEKIALGALHRRVADHSRSTSHESVRLMPAALEVLEYHYAYQMADMQRVSRRVDPNVGGSRAFHKFFFSPWHDVMDHASPFQFLYKILHRCV